MNTQKPRETEAGDPYCTPATSVIAIGASEGGLEALIDTLAQARPTSPAAFVVIQHLALDQGSILHELLQKECKIPVTQVVQDEVVEHGRVYVVPYGKLAQMRRGMIYLTNREEPEQAFRPIDHFFGSLADDLGRNGYCVVLSGAGSDGTEGLRAIKSADGITVAQATEGVRFPAMPQAAIATGLVDLVLTPRDMIPRLVEIIQHRSKVINDAGDKRLTTDIEKILPQIYDRMRDITGNDFSGYKTGTAIRHIERRMTLKRVTDGAAFLKILQEDDTEANLLTQDFLIGVTSFFRDSNAFDTLRDRVIIPLVDTKPEMIRVWVPGCSTGEEVYSLAMLFHEALEKIGHRCVVQLFGTDLDNHALRAARNGLYSQASIANLSEERLHRFFSVDNGSYRVAPHLRETCVFAPHNLVQDPPFSRIDLISCRNVMISLSKHLQNHVLPRFHFSLNPQGYLFLGPSEGLAGSDALFNIIDTSHRIFKRNDAVGSVCSSLGEFMLRPDQSCTPPRISAAAQPSEPAATVSWESLAERAFLDRHAAPFALVTGSGEVQYLSHAMAKFARPAAGAPTSQIDGFLRSELRVPVRRALNAIQDTKEEQSVIGVLVGSDTDQPQMFDFTLSSIGGVEGSFLLVLTQVREADTQSLSNAVLQREALDYEGIVGENTPLRRQLIEKLQEFEASGQKIKSSHEEFLNMNEKLEASNEELQTINEELETVNTELHENNKRLVQANSDLQNLFESTDIAVLFLDRNFLLRSFTPPTKALYGVKERDIGRSVLDLSSRIDYPDLRADAEEVETTLQPVEREVQTSANDATYLLRIRPYRTTDDCLDGYVVSFVNITRRKRTEQALEDNQRALAEQYAELENIYDTTPVGLSLVDRNFRYVRINTMMAEINGFTVQEHLSKSFNELLPNLADDMSALYGGVMRTGKSSLRNEIAAELPSEPGRIRHFLADLYPIWVDGEVTAIGTCVTETTEQKRLLAELAESESRIRQLFDSSPVFISFTEGPDHIYTYSNPPNNRIIGNRDLIGKPLLDALPELQGQGIRQRFDRVFKTGEPENVPEYRAMLDRDGTGELTPGWYSQSLEPIRDGEGRVTGVASFAYEISEIVHAKNEAQRAEEQKTLLLGELQHRVKNMLATVRAISKLLVPGAGDAQEYQARLSARLLSMSRTHDLLFGEGIVSTGVHSLIKTEAAPYQGIEDPCISFTGDDFNLSSDEAPLIGMALHELMTNAAKHGALSQGTGRIDIHCQVDTENGTRSLSWRESGGPKVRGPENKGFGSIVIEQVLATNLKANVATDFDPDGLKVTVRLKPNRKDG